MNYFLHSSIFLISFLEVFRSCTLICMCFCILSSLSLMGSSWPTPNPCHDNLFLTLQSVHHLLDLSRPKTCSILSPFALISIELFLIVYTYKVHATSQTNMIVGRHILSTSCVISFSSEHVDLVIVPLFTQVGMPITSLSSFKVAGATLMTCRALDLTRFRPDPSFSFGFCSDRMSSGDAGFFDD